MKASTGLGLIVCSFMFFMMIPEVSATIWTVGGDQGWTAGVNYTHWSEETKIYTDDWLAFVYERRGSVLEVNRSSFNSCNSESPIHNWTSEAGRSVIPLKIPQKYYFITGDEGFCYGGQKVAVEVSSPPVPADSAASCHKLSALVFISVCWLMII
ncbi:hypothetical protein MKW94_021394 [Papaver nudicaule]|uniref:Phytocyanin domain-containing protein n=1 Tax=Papaver nudicaule TaxID=74823 RepID=A0AA41W056_PAPNU|nr:hypothetical protein [Papaver nudicaule]